MKYSSIICIFCFCFKSRNHKISKKWHILCLLLNVLAYVSLTQHVVGLVDVYFWIVNLVEIVWPNLSCADLTERFKDLSHTVCNRFSVFLCDWFAIWVDLIDNNFIKQTKQYNKYKNFWVFKNLLVKWITVIGNFSSFFLLEILSSRCNCLLVAHFSWLEIPISH